MTGLEIASLVTAAGSTAASAGNAISQANMNKKNREWQEKMYNIQRKDALSDTESERNWASPSNQMALYREAGINPTQALTANAVQSPSTRSSDVPSAETEAPKVDPSSMINLAQVLESQSRTRQNEANTSLLREKTVTEALEQAQTRYKIAIEEGNLELQRATMEDIIKYSRLQNELLSHDIETAKGEGKRRDRSVAASESQAASAAQNADTNVTNAATSARNADVNAANARTNATNAQTAKWNAQTASRNADTNERNAKTNEANSRTQAAAQKASETLSLAQIQKLEAEVKAMGYEKTPWLLRMFRDSSKAIQDDNRNQLWDNLQRLQDSGVIYYDPYSKTFEANDVPSVKDMPSLDD